MLLFDVTQRFDAHLRKLFQESNKEVLNFLLKHERKQLCLNNLCNQILVAEASSKVKVNIDSFQLLIEETAKLFANAAIDARIHELMTPAEKTRRQSEVSKLDEIKSVVVEVDRETKPKTQEG